MDNSAQYARGVKVYDTRAGITKFVTSHPKFFGLFFLLGLISAGFFVYKYLTAPKILASVNGIPIYEKYVITKKNNACLTSIVDTPSQSLNKIIDFYILKEGARQLGIVVTTEELRNFVKGNQSTRTKLCPEEHESLLLSSKIQQAITPIRKVEILMTQIDQKKAIEQLAKEYTSLKYQSLRQALLAIAPQATSSSTVVQRIATPDMERTGIFEDDTIFNEVFKLHQGEISSIVTPQKGYALHKLVLLRVFEATDKNNYPSFNAWFARVKQQAKIQRYQ